MENLKLYLLQRKDQDDYDTFNSALVCAINEEDAKSIHPNGKDFSKEIGIFNTWVNETSLINVTEIGLANEKQTRGVIIASYNAQ